MSYLNEPKTFLKIDDNLYIDLKKARPTKYIKRIPKASGKGYTYIYKESVKKEKNTEKPKEKTEENYKSSGVELFYNYRRNKSELDEEVIFAVNNPESSRHYGNIVRVMKPTEKTLDLRKDSENKKILENYFIDFFEEWADKTISKDEAKDSLNPNNIVESGQAWDNIEFINYLYDQNWFDNVDGVITNDGAVFFESNKDNTIMIKELEEDEEIIESQIKSKLKKARPTKYIKRIPKASGKGYTYVYKEKKEGDTKTPAKGEKKTEPDKKTEDKKPVIDTKNRNIIKNTLKKVANILAEALSGRDVVQPTGAAIEQAGESGAGKTKKTPIKKEIKK